MTHISRSRKGFTLVEILVVIGIILLLAALLFPVFASAQRSARQTNCAANLQQIYNATRLYYNDEKRYPSSLVDLLPEGAKFDNGGTQGEISAATATGYLKGGQDLLLCPSDETDSMVPRSSYGALTNTLTANFPASPTVNDDAGRYVWNYWGYDDRGYAYASETTTGIATGDHSRLVSTDASAPDVGKSNPIKYSLANRFAPSSTIITHCPFHRFETANNLNSAGDLYGASPLDSTNAREIVVRLDGTVKNVDVAQWKANDTWRKQLP